MTAQEIIKIFMAKLANHGFANSSYIGNDMLDLAIKASSRYEGIQAVIDAMTADQVAAEKAAVEEVLGSDYADKLISDIDSSILSQKATEYNDVYKKSNMYIGDKYSYSSYSTTVEDVIKERKASIFLETYCGIQLPKKYWYNGSSWTSWKGDDGLTGNDDTGAITGSDAGGSSVAKTDSSVVPEEFINTYIASTSTAQNIITNGRDWVVQATSSNDTITSNGADSINAGAGDDKIIANTDGATITSGDGADFITVSSGVNDITLSDLNSDDTLTISGTFKVGSAQIEDSLLVITDKTGTRKIRLGDFDNNAKNAKINSTTIGEWLTNAGIDLDNLTTKNYADDKVIASGNSRTLSSTPNSNSNTTDGAITVDLANVDTSAAGDVTVDGETIGTLSSTFPNASTFTRNGLTIHLLGEIQDSTSNYPENDDGDPRITGLTFDELTDDQKTIIAGLFKWWGNECLKLNEDSYDIGFNSSTTMIKDIGLYFYNGGEDGTLATVWNWQRNYTDGTGDGVATQLMLNVNMSYYEDISSDDMDGTSTVSSAGLLDRTLAHEFTHAIMAANVNFFGSLPKFIKEGIAELTHGIDDERGGTIFEIAFDATELAGSLDLANTGTGSQDVGDGYAGGYMFYRYFAKQAAAQTETLPAFGEITATVNLAGDGDYYISGNSTSETASTTAQGIKIGTVSNGVYTVADTGVHQVITNTNNLKIVGLTINDTLIGGDGSDIVGLSQGSFLQTGTGDDSIQLTGQYATIETGAGDDSIYIVNGSHHSINLGDGDNLVSIQTDRNYNNTITGGDGNNSILSGSSTNGLITTGAGADSIYFGGNGNTVSTGAGDDTIEFEYSNMSENRIDLGAGNDSILFGGSLNTIYGGDGNNSIYQYDNSDGGNYFAFDSAFGTDTIRGFKSNDTILLAEDFNYSVSTQSKRYYVTVTKDNEQVGRIVLSNPASFSASANIVKGLKVDNTSEIVNSENNTVVAGTSAADTITNKGSTVTIQALGGDDTIDNYGSTVSIDGGADNDLINLYGGAGVTVDVSAGDDTISVGSDVTEFNISGFSAGDVIDLASAANSIETVDGGIKVGSVTISGLNAAATAFDWAFENNLATYTQKISSGATLSADNKSIVFAAAQDSAKVVALSGVQSTAGLSINIDSKVVTVSAAALNKANVTADNNFTLALADDVSKSTTTAAAWTLDGTTATYNSSSTTEGYTASGNTITYSAAQIGDKVVGLSGVQSTAGLSINIDSKVVTVSAAALSKANVTADNNFTLALADDVSKSTTTAAAWTLDGTTATYNSASTTEGYTASGNTITYSAEQIGDKVVALSGVQSTAGLSINIDSKVVTVSAAALNKANVTADNNFTLSLADDVSKSTTTAAAWTLDGTTATYNSASTTEGYTASGNTITYSAAQIGDKVVALSGVQSTAGLSINIDSKVVTVSAAALSKANVTADNNFTLALADDVSKSTTIDAGWSFLNEIATYSLSSITEGYTASDNQITYVESIAGTALAELSGIAKDSTPTLDETTMTFAADNFDDDVAVISSTVNNFSLTAGNYADKLFTATDKADRITNAGSKLIIDGAAGNDKISNRGSFVTVSGGTGNDNVSLSGDGGGNTYIYTDGDGKDILYNFKGNDTIQIIGTTAIEENIKNNDAIFKVGKGTVTVRDAATSEMTIALVDSVGNAISENTYTASGIISGDKIELAATLKKPYTQAATISVVDGSKVKDGAQIIGNDKGGTLLGGEGKDTLIGGTGDFALTGGKGNDLFVFGGGNDTIFDYSAKGTYGADKISVASSLDNANYSFDGDNLILDYGIEDDLTIIDGKGKEITFAGRKSTIKIYADEGIFDGKKKSLILAADTEDSFSAAKYSKLITLDGSAVINEIQLTGNKKANYIVAGKGNSTLDGGKGKDSLIGGEGADVFIYNAKTGNKVISGYSYDDGDLISLGSGAEISQVTTKRGDVTLKIGSNKITIEDTAQFNFAQDGETKTYDDGKLISGDSVTLASDFKGTFSLEENDSYNNASAELGKKAVNLIGNAEDNLLIGGKGKDTLWGGDGTDTFVYKEGQGKDVIFDYESGELLTILDKKNNAGTFTESAFSDNTLTLTIGNGKVTFRNVDAATTFNINNENYHVSDNKLEK